MTAGAAPGRGKWSTLRSTTYPSPSGGRSLHSDPCGKASGALSHLRRMSVYSVWLCNLLVALCVVVYLMLHRVPLHIRVSPETRQRLQFLRTQRHLNVGSSLRALIDEALEEQQTTNGPEAEKGKAGGCSQPDISDPKHGQLATPLDGPGGRVSGVERSQACPPTSRIVQWIPVQIEGYNEGIETGQDTVSLL